MKAQDLYHIDIIAVAEDGREFVASRSIGIYSGDFQVAKTEFIKSIPWDFDKKPYIVRKSPIKVQTFKNERKKA